MSDDIFKRKTKRVEIKEIKKFNLSTFWPLTLVIFKAVSIIQFNITMTIIIITCNDNDNDDMDDSKFFCNNESNTIIWFDIVTTKKLTFFVWQLLIMYEYTEGKWILGFNDRLVIIYNKAGLVGVTYIYNIDM